MSDPRKAEGFLKQSLDAFHGDEHRAALGLGQSRARARIPVQGPHSKESSLPFRFRAAPIAGPIVIEARRFEDERGAFLECFRREDFRAAGIGEDFVQDNASLSRKGVLRGLHFQRPPAAQGKLLRVGRGRSFTVAVDLREGSASFGLHFSLELSAEEGLLLWLPPGFAHGFLALEEETELIYKCSAEYRPELEEGIRWDDPRLAIAWPLEGTEPILSRRDALLPAFDPGRVYFPRGGGA